MNILINCSNLSGGGGGQVADSVCSYTNIFPQHHFVVVYSRALESMGARVGNYDNVESIEYSYPSRDYKSLFTGRNTFLDEIVENKHIDCVLTVFGPMKWRPRCSHVSGFALSQLVIPESPYFQLMSFGQRFKSCFSRVLDTRIFCRGTKHLYTENPFISERVEALIKHSEVRTITNYYNQVFDDRDAWKYKQLDGFNGISLLTLSSPYPHKNIAITIDIARILKDKHPEFKFRFVLSIKKEDLPPIDQSIEDCFLFLDKVEIEECPSLYEQCDFAFVPSLIECFTAMYAEAMRMKVPIITTDLPFARGLCGKAALYYEPLSAKDAAGVIFNLSNNDKLIKALVKKGEEQLNKFDTSEQRARKLIKYCEDVCSMN